MMNSSLHYFILLSLFTLLSGCSSFTSTTNSKPTKFLVYKGIYEEEPLSVLIMPPVNKSTNVDAKEIFHSTLNIPLANAGYYVVPPFLSMEMLKKESAYNSDLFLNTDLNKFGEVFGADVALFTIIHQWRKSPLESMIYVEIEYILKSIETNEVLFSRKGLVTQDTSSKPVVDSGFTGTLLNMVASAVNTSSINYTKAARTCNEHAFRDLPLGKYSSRYGLDRDEFVKDREFEVELNN